MKYSVNMKAIYKSSTMHIKQLSLLLFIIALISCKTNVADDLSGIEDSLKAYITTVPMFEEVAEKPLSKEIISSEEHNEKTEIENYIYNTLWRCTKERYSASENPNQFMMFDPLASVLWPGNLVQGNSIASGVPNSIPIAPEKRKPGAISMTIVSSDVNGAENKYYRQVDMSLSKVNQAMNEILSGYTGGAVAKYNFSMENVYSESQFAASLGAGASAKCFSSNSKFNIDWSKKLTRIAVKLYQQYFTMAYDDPQGIEGVFNHNITLNDVKNYTGNGNPMCYISSVTYGRIYILVYESTASERELNAALNFAYKGITTSGYLENEVHYKNIMEKTNIKLMQIGGDPETGLSNATAADVNKIQEFLTKGANFSAKSVGAPISYIVKYLKDAKLVRMNNTLEYEVDQCVAVSKDSALVESEFAVYFNTLEAIHGTEKYSFNVYSTIEVGIYDKITGNSTAVWNSPTDNNSSKKLVGTFSGMQPKTYFLDWNVPVFKVKSDPNLSIYFQFSTEIGGASSHFNKMYLDYDNELHQWFPRSNNHTDYSEYGNNPQTLVSVKYKYIIKQNNKKLE